MRFGIIGGTGLYGMGGEAQQRVVDTDYGAIALDVVSLAGQEVAFVARHGRGHTIPPHMVNYRGIIAALRSLGASRILASAAVGTLNPIMQPGDFALPDQFLDFTRGRPSTFFDGAQGEVRHTDMTVPYCPQLREELQRAGDFLGDALHAAAVYVCTDGPRFETPAEIEMFRRLAGDLVGMTGVPEVSLAREAGMCYAALAVITNWAAGLAESPIKHDDVSAHMEQQTATVQRIFTQVIENWRDRPCPNCALDPSGRG
jgi:5'-methylthioadenosine phosphorylase